MLRIIDGGHPAVLAFLIDGEITAKDVEQLMQALEQKLSRFARINIYREIVRIGRVRAGVAVVLVKFFRRFGFFKLLKRVERVAVVSDLKWVPPVVRCVRPLFRSLDIRPFSLQQKAAALNWLQEFS